MEKLLDGVEVEWRTLGDVIESLKTGLNPRKNFQLNTSDAKGFGNIGWWYKQYYTI
jgi:type I restriction enzyme S subunit